VVFYGYETGQTCFCEADLALRKGDRTMDINNLEAIDDLDRLRTFNEAAKALGIPYFKVQRAARRGIIPTYSLLNSRRYVKLSDILTRMSEA